MGCWSSGMGMVKESFRLLLWPMFLLALIVYGCDNASAPPCLKATGSTVSEGRPLPTALQTIVINDNIDVILTESTNPKANYYAGKNLLPDLLADTSAQPISESDQPTALLPTITLSNSNTCNWVRSYNRLPRFNISAPNIRLIQHEGYGSLTCGDSLYGLNGFLQVNGRGAADINLLVKTGYMRVDLKGATSIKIAGSAFYSYISTLGLGVIDMRQIPISKMEVFHRGENTVTITCTSILKVVLRGTGNVVVYGNPTSRDITDTGEGKVIFK